MAVRRLAEIQPDSFAFTPENQAWVDKQIAKYPAGRQASAVMALLRRAQVQNGGWVRKPAIEKVAEILDMPDIRVLEIATFYSMYNLKPVGKYFIQMCGTTPCVLRGSDGIKAVLAARVGAAGARDGRRPVLLARGRVPRRLLQRADGADQRRLLRGPDAGEFLQAARRPRGRARPVKIGSQTGRMTSEPDGGLTTLTGLYGTDGRGGSNGAARSGSPSQPSDGGQLPTDQDNAPNAQTHGGLDLARDNEKAKPQGSIADTGTRTDVPVGEEQIESSALTQNTPQQAAERQEQSTRNNPPVPGPAGKTGH